VARPFAYGANPFRAGWHRGVDLAAPVGAPVRAACPGVVVTARPGVVTLRCGPWRVTHLPLGSVAVRAGASVRAGHLVGTVGAGGEHRGLHLGVRRAGDRFAYVDPLLFLTNGTRTPPTVPAPRTTRVPRTGPGSSRAVGPPGAAAAPPPAAVPATPAQEVRVSAPTGARALAPWPAWAGLALLLLGALGGGVRIRARRARVARTTPVPSPAANRGK
jgi:hypothetical protein